MSFACSGRCGKRSRVPRAVTKVSISNKSSLVGLASADRLPVVVRIPAGPLGSLKCDPPKGNGRRPQKKISNKSSFWVIPRISCISVQRALRLFISGAARVLLREAFVFSHLSLPCRGASWGVGSGTGAGSFWGHRRIPLRLARAYVSAVAVVHSSGCWRRSCVGGGCVCWSHQSFARLLCLATGHERQVLCGGVSVEAHRRPLPTRCSLCQSECVPSTERPCSCFSESSRSPPTP